MSMDDKDYIMTKEQLLYSMKQQTLNALALRGINASDAEIEDITVHLAVCYITGWSEDRIAKELRRLIAVAENNPIESRVIIA